MPVNTKKVILMVKDDKDILESLIERRLVRELKAIGAICIKLDPTGCAGIMDRLVLYQDTTMLVEVKRPVGGRLSDVQKERRDQVTQWNIEYRIVKNHKDIDDLVALLKTRAKNEPRLNKKPGKNIITVTGKWNDE